MKRRYLFVSKATMIVLIAIANSAATSARVPDARADEFWKSFQSAVAKQDVGTIASMTKFPLQMPYGQRSIANSTVFARKYASIFDRDTRKCMAAAKPEFEEGKKNRFSISCGEAMMYWFEKVNGQFKFTGVDNVNE